jgi:hypothetical protein
MRPLASQGRPHQCHEVEGRNNLHRHNWILLLLYIFLIRNFIDRKQHIIILTIIFNQVK